MCGANPCSKPNCSWSEAWKAECEARMLASKPADWRREFYVEVEKKRGPAALADLKKRVGEAWKKNQQQPSLL